MQSDKSLSMSITIPGRENAHIEFQFDKGVNNESAYHAKHVRRLAWVLMQALPLHVIEHLIRELMVQAQETVIRGARLESAQMGKRLVISVKDPVDSPFPGQLHLWHEDGPVPSKAEIGGPEIQEEEEFLVSEAPEPPGEDEVDE